jgi:hypothetical protein
MKHHGMIFNSEMVRAILDGRKTQTRRTVKPQPPEGSRLWGMPKVWDDKRNLIFWREGDRSNYGKPLQVEVGDIIWVRETFRPISESDTGFTGIEFRAGGMPDDDTKAGLLHDGTDRWRPSIHMPRWASRIDLEVTAVRVERVQEISEEDAKREGATPVEYEGMEHPDNPWMSAQAHKDAFRNLWQSIYTNWDANPWVWVYEFRRVK